MNSPSASASPSDKTASDAYPTIIHISFGPPTLIMVIGGKKILFEDHPMFGPHLVDKFGNVLDDQPEELDLFWVHYSAWRDQGKQLIITGKRRWCKYETRIQAVRKATQRAREASAAAASDGDNVVPQGPTSQSSARKPRLLDQTGIAPRCQCELPVQDGQCDRNLRGKDPEG